MYHPEKDFRMAFRTWLKEEQHISDLPARNTATTLIGLMKVLSEEELMTGEPIALTELYLERRGKSVARITKSNYRRAIRFWQLYIQEAAA